MGNYYDVMAKIEGGEGSMENWYDKALYKNLAEIAL